MLGMTDVQTVQSPYFAMEHPITTAAKASVKVRKPQKSHLGQDVFNDLSLIYPEAVVASSQTLGWRNVLAVHMRHESNEWNIPPLENHSIIIPLGPSPDAESTGDVDDFDHYARPGEIAIVPAGLPSNWRQRDGRATDTLQLYLHPNFVRATAKSWELHHGEIVIEPQFGVSDEHIHHIGMSLLWELKEANVVGRMYADSLAEVLAMQLVRRYSCLKDVQISRGGMAPRKLRKAIEFITENLDQEQTVALAAVADEVGMSYFHFSRAFKQAMGISPHVYMIEQRIERAKKLLAETDLPIAGIALRAGFASQSHFTTTFRKLTWTTPKTFREML